MPKAELHLHIEGTLEPEMIFVLAERNGVALGDDDVTALRLRYRFEDLRSFLDLYFDNLAVLRRAADYAEMTRAYLVRAAHAGVRHAEIFFDPQAHTGRGVALGEVLDGIGDALARSEARHGISTALIANFLRDRPAREAMDTLEALLAAGAPIVGVGLDSAEVGHPPSKFTAVFERARAEGLACVAHAGEEGPAGYITEALDLLTVRRIDHGIRCLDDDRLVDRLVHDRVPLTVCPLSNVRLRVVERMVDHPLPAMLARGLVVTVNSDDPAYFGGYLDDNLAALVDAFGLGDDQLARLARHSFEASWLDGAARSAHLGAVDAWERAGLSA